jgi:hypothetical protein
VKRMGLKRATKQTTEKPSYFILSINTSIHSHGCVTHTHNSTGKLEHVGSTVGEVGEVALRSNILLFRAGLVVRCSVFTCFIGFPFFSQGYRLQGRAIQHAATTFTICFR